MCSRPRFLLAFFVFAAPVFAEGRGALTPSYEEIVAPGEASHDARCAQMAAWLSTHPNDPRVPRALIWMAQLRALDGRGDLARDLFRRTEQEFPGTPWARHASNGLAVLDLEQGHFSTALERYRSLAQSEDPFFAYLGAQGIELVRAQRFRVWLSLALLGVLLLLWGWLAHLAGGLRALWPPPAELTWTLPVPALLFLSAFTQPAGEARALQILGLGMVTALWVNGSFLSARPWSRSRRLAWAILGALQAGALLYCAVSLSGIWEKFRDTLVMGTE